MRRIQVAFTTMLLSFVAAQASAGDRTLGPLSITGDETVVLHFIGNGAGAASSFPVAVRFFDAAGVLVASSAGSCPFDVCPPGFLPVDSTRVTTVSLSGAALGLVGDQTMTIQPLVSAPGPGLAHLLTTLDLFNANSAERVVLRFDPSTLVQPLPLPPRLTLGPVTLGNGELARFHAGYYGAGLVAFNMFFLNASGVQIGTSKAVKLHYLESDMIELDGDATGIAGVPGVIRADTTAVNTGRTLVTLEIIDKATGAVKTVLADGGGIGVSNGGGGADSQ